MIDLLEPVNGQALYIDTVVIMKVYTTDPVSIDKSAAHMYIGETLQLNANKEGVVFTSDNKSVAKVSLRGEVTAISAGTAKITATYGAEKAYCYVTVDEKYHNLADGTYYIRNVEHGKYLQVDDGDKSNGYGSENAIMELWDYSAGDFQKWKITYVGQGYYKVINAQSSLALSVQSGYENTDNKALIQETYQGNNRQLWAISVLSDGYYKFEAKSSEGYQTDWCMAAGSGAVLVNGRNVEQRAFVQDTDYIDEWRLFYMDGSEFVGIAIENDGNDRSSEFDDIFYSMSFTEYGDYYFDARTSITAKEYLNKLDNAKIFFSRSHGTYGSNYTAVQIADSDFVYSTDLASYDLSNLELAIFSACYTAENFDSGKNLPTACVEAGAKCAIGFETTIATYYANDWMDYFFENYAELRDVEEACEFASKKFNEATGLKSVKIVTKGE